MNFIKNLKFKTLVLLFVSSILLNLLVSNILIYFAFETFLYPSVQKVTDFLVAKATEEKIEFSLVKNGALELDKEEILISKNNFPFEIPQENIFYISKKANLETLRSKNALIAINNNRIFSEIEKQDIVINIWDQFPTLERITINIEAITNLRNWIFENKVLQFVVLASLNTISSIIQLSMYFLLVYFISRYICRYILSIRNKAYTDLNLKIVSLIFLISYNIIDPILRTISILLNFPSLDVLSLGLLSIIFLLVFSSKSDLPK